MVDKMCVGFIGKVKMAVATEKEEAFQSQVNVYHIFLYA